MASFQLIPVYRDLLRDDPGIPIERAIVSVPCPDSEAGFPRFKEDPP